MTHRKYDKIRIFGSKKNSDILTNPNDEIVLQEKMDGANIMFMFKNNNIIFGSRNRQITFENNDDSMLDKNFIRCVKYIRKQLSILNEFDKSRMEGYIFYGENMISHSLNYNWNFIPPFLGFDIYNMNTNKYENYDSVRSFYLNLNLPMVPLIRICKAKDITIIDDTLVPISMYAPKDKPTQQAEGIVIKNYSKQIFAKYVRTEFKEVNKNAFGGIIKYQENDTDKINAKYCTNNRINKNIFKLIDDGNDLELSLMSKLPKEVYKDIMEEHWEDIVYSKMNINFKQLNKKITKRCLTILNQIITNEGLTNE